MSLDGRLAGEDDDLAFLATIDGGFEDTPYQMHRVIEGFDSIVVGARTFRVILRHIEEGKFAAWPYGDRPVWVLSHMKTLPDVPGASNLRLMAGTADQVMAAVAEEPVSRTWLLGGGEVAAQFLAADHVDELILGLAPSLVGRGPSLADGVFPLRRFTLEDVRRDKSSLALRYVRPR
ncbi:dihydrofolate reductase family protein [Marinivivus vitaminiproducens]|uniref:dihydrofolate reductase family protein n=1 Tax=Marinivivus vitaminiproducens TaxID=3035935 RepID=UPI0027A30012|nr:dihydrofolate reductase family protein [Geminicoccaceae bacterium SCSIO 64248]